MLKIYLDKPNKQIILSEPPNHIDLKNKLYILYTDKETKQRKVIHSEIKEGVTVYDLPDSVPMSHILQVVIRREW